MSGVEKILAAGRAMFPDEYDIKARWAPALFAIAPPLTLAAIAIPEIGDHQIGTGTVGTAVLLSLRFVTIRVVRDIGYARQETLFQEWGGKPTTAMLRYRDTRINLYTKERLHGKLRQLGPDIIIPTAAEEEADPAAADLRYESAADELRTRAKAAKVPAVHRENIGYGFARNIYGLKSFGLLMCAASLGVLGLKISLREVFAPTPGEIAVGFAIGLATVVWIFGCTRRMVRTHAESYGHTLFEAVDGLTSAGPAPRKRRKRTEDA